MNSTVENLSGRGLDGGGLPQETGGGDAGSFDRTDMASSAPDKLSVEDEAARRLSQAGWAAIGRNAITRYILDLAENTEQTIHPM